MSQTLLVATCGLVAGLLLWFARTTPGARRIVPIAFLAGAGFCFVPDPSLRLIALVPWGIAVVLGLGLRIGARAGVRLGAAAFAALVGTGLADIVRFRDSLPRDSGHPLAASYPFESMAPRLAYESRRPGIAPVAGFSKEVESKHDRDETDPRWTLRAEFLYRLHNANARRFRDAQGFGWTRMGELVPEALNLQSVPAPLPLEMPEPTRYDWMGEAQTLPSPETMGAKHAASRSNFLRAEANGYVRDRTQVAGFVPHAFRSSKRTSFENSIAASLKGPTWTLTRLQLVSLLRFAEPRVYETNEFPDMARLVHVPTRPLTPFESDALARLQEGEEVVYDEDRHHLRMAGSLLALESCCRCHDVPRGTLLGAFSYVFSRSPSKTADGGERAAESP